MLKRYTLRRGNMLIGKREREWKRRGVRRVRRGGRRASLSVYLGHHENTIFSWKFLRAGFNHHIPLSVILALALVRV
jgi:hypothetical protein